MRKFLTAILVCFSVICLAAMTACSDGGDSGSDIGNNSASKSEIISETTSETVSETETADESESETTDESQSESQSENEPEVPVEVGYKIEVYAEMLDGTFVKTALDKTGTAGDTVVITAAILQAANVIPKGYNFDETDERNVLSGTLEENKSLSLTVYLKLKEYEVVFKNEDGTVLQSGKVKHGATPSYSGTPEKEADKTYTYAFKSWDKELAAANGDVTYTAEYDKSYIEYTITFDLANGEESVVATCHYGDPVTVPANPTKEGYTFLGWDKEIAATCDGNATYTAGYAENVEYTVKHVKKSVFGYSEVMETEQKSGHKQTDVTTFKKEYDDLVYIDYSLGDTETVVEFYYGADGITYNTPNFTPTGYTGYGSYTEKGKVTDGDRVYDNVYEASVTAGTDTTMLNIAYGDNVGKYLFLPIKQNYNYVGGDLQFIDGKGVYHNANDYPLWFDKNGNAIVYSTSNTDWMVMAVLLTEADYPKDGALNLNLFLWRLGTVQIGEYTFVTSEQIETLFATTYSTVNHYARNIDGSFTLVETENNITCIGLPTAKNYSAHVYSTATVIDGVCNMFYEYEEITFNTPNFAATGFDGVGGYVEKGTIEDGTSIRYNVYEATVNSGAGEARLNIAYGNNTGKWLILPIKQTYSLVNNALQFIDGNGGWHTDNNYPTWFDINGATITYDSSYTGWKIMAVHLDSTSFPANGALNVNFFLWNLGTVQIGEYTFVTSEQIETLFATTYSTVNHYARNIDGSFTLVETENNVTCIGLPTAKNYSAHVYSTATVIDGVCNMFYEYEEITFNTPNFAATGFDRVGGYVEKGTIEDGTSIRYNVYEATVNSGAGEARLNIAYGNNTGKWLLLPIKQTYSLVNSALQFIDGNGGWHTDDNYPTWFDINGATITYDSSYTGWKIMAVHLDSPSFPANGALNVNFFLWNLGAVQIGEYAFVTQEQLNLLGYYSGSETSDIQVNGWVAPESYSDDMLEKIAAAGLTSVSFAAAGTQYIDPSDLSSSKDIINRYAKYGINIYTVGGVANFASMGDFANYGNVLGLMLDEPNKSQIDEIAAVIDTFNTANVGNKVLIVNLLPSYASAVTSDFSAYSAYLKYLYDNVLGKLKCELWISVDRYPIVRDAKGNPTLDSGWLDDVEAVATFAKANGLKKNFFIQTMPYGSGGFNDSHDRTPTKADISLQYYALLAYGYDSISLFCLGTPAPDGTTFLDGQNAMINRNNETTDIYTAVKEVNEELNKFDFILNRFSWEAAVLKTSSLSTSVQAKKIGLKDISSTKNALFSHLVDKTRGREAYCVVNYNDTSLNYPNTITLTFSGETILTVIQNGGFRTVTSTSGEFTFTLGVGESIIVIK